MTTDDRTLEQRIDEHIERLRPTLAAHDAATAAALEQHRRAARASAEAHELTSLALRRYMNDALTHARIELAVRVVEQGPAGRTITNLRREGYERAAEDLRAGLVAAGAVVIELAENDRPTAEAQLARVRRVCAELLAGDHRDRAAADRVLKALA